MEFNITINASTEKVWQTLLGEETYPQWTAAFSETSRVETDWQKGSKAIFTDQSNKGMVSKIVENIPNEFLSIQHLGYYDNGEEDYDSEATKKWAGALENYTLTAVDGKTNLQIYMEMNTEEKEMIAMFEKMWPKALAKVKELAEGSTA
jgi:uncharacterized protein YndB with AHSA1/START domain